MLLAPPLALLSWMLDGHVKSYQGAINWFRRDLFNAKHSSCFLRADLTAITFIERYPLEIVRGPTEFTGLS